ncbi:MAG: acetylxylan esterase [Kiritimatiellia bacterium]
MGITLWQSLSNCADQIQQKALKNVRTFKDWEKQRPKRYREFMRSMGLDPLPERCDLKITGYGALSGKGFSGRKIGFQIMPDCWASAAIYYPDPLPPGRLPAVLYVCGHATIGTHALQFHPIMWARRGYACLIVDTIEQNDNPGEHHGNETGQMESWVSMGYTSAGGELWNSIRALDVLAADPCVDPERLGVTGVSGGGALSFYLSIADERIKAASILCGVSTNSDAIGNRCLIGHCNCFYLNNVYRHDTSEFAALAAPRAFQVCNADDDMLFHPDKVKEMMDKTRKVFKLYGCANKCRLVTCPGKHGDHPEFYDATVKWFDAYVAGEKHPDVKAGKAELSERTTAVFNGCPPAPNRLDLLPQLLSPRGTLPLPASGADWPDIRRRALAAMPPFHGDDGKTILKQAIAWKVPTSTTVEQRRRIDGVDVWLYTRTEPDAGKTLILGIAGQGGGARDMIGVLYNNVPPASKVILAGFEPRLGGLTCPVPPNGAFSMKKLVPFALPLLGLTSVMMTCHDIGVAVNYILGLRAMKGVKLFLYGKGEAGVAALYRGILDEHIAGVILEDIPSSHLDGAPVMGILRAFDMPQAVGLMAPRKVGLVNPGHNCWTWPSRVFDRLGCPERFVREYTLANVLPKITS